MNLTVKLKLGLSFAALTLLVLFVSLTAMVELAKFNGTFSGYVEGVNAREELASGLLIATQRRAVAARNLVLVSSGMCSWSMPPCLKHTATCKDTSVT